MGCTAKLKQKGHYRVWVCFSTVIVSVIWREGCHFPLESIWHLLLDMTLVRWHDTIPGSRNMDPRTSGFVAQKRCTFLWPKANAVIINIHSYFLTTTSVEYELLMLMPFVMSFPICPGISLIFGRFALSGFQWWPAMYAWTTVIRFVVSVPVLSEQIVVAFPIVSQASRCRTKLLSAIIFCK